MMTMIYSVSLNVSNRSILFTTDKQCNTTRDYAYWLGRII